MNIHEGSSEHAIDAMSRSREDMTSDLTKSRVQTESVHGFGFLSRMNDPTTSSNNATTRHFTGSDRKQNVVSQQTQHGFGFESNFNSQFKSREVTMFNVGNKTGSVNFSR